MRKSKPLQRIDCGAIDPNDTTCRRLARITRLAQDLHTAKRKIYHLETELKVTRLKCANQARSLRCLNVTAVDRNKELKDLREQLKQVNISITPTPRFTNDTDNN